MPASSKNAIAIAFFLTLVVLLSPISALETYFAPTTAETNPSAITEINVTVRENETAFLFPLTTIKKTKGFLYTARIEGDAAKYARLTMSFRLNYDFVMFVNAKKFIERGFFSDVFGTLVINEFSLQSLDKQTIRVPLRLKASFKAGVPAKAKTISEWIISKTEKHHGIDYFNSIGTPVMAAYEGTVDWINYVDLYDKGKGGNAEACGKGIGIKHGGMLTGYRTIYCHLSKVKVKIGENVSTCQEIGSIGRTGNAWNRPAHLHFELKEIVLNPPDGERINPALIFEKGSNDCSTVATKKQ